MDGRSTAERAGVQRCALAEAYRHTAAAAARFRLSARPYIGTRTRASAAAASSAGRPCASEPNSHAVRPRRAGRRRSGRPGRCRRTRRRRAPCSPAARSASTTATGSAARTTSTWKRLPARGPHALAVVRVDGVAGEDHRARAGRVGGAQHGAGVARVADLGEHRAPAGARRARACASGTSRCRQTATSPCGCDGLGQRRQRVVGHRRRPAASARAAVAASSGYRSSAVGGAEQLGDHARPREGLADRLRALGEEPAGWRRGPGGAAAAGQRQPGGYAG